MTETDEEAWCAERRATVAEYLSDQGIVHGEIGEWPAWRAEPYVSVWAVESICSPGWVGWWAISGDLPTDYCSAHDCRHPRLAVKKFAEQWRSAVEAIKPGDATLGDTSLPISLAPLLAKRADLLLQFVADNSLWPE
jgi:hypothetical protein